MFKPADVIGVLVVFVILIWAIRTFIDGEDGR